MKNMSCRMIPCNCHPRILVYHTLHSIPYFDIAVPNSSNMRMEAGLFFCISNCDLYRPAENRTCVTYLPARFPVEWRPVKKKFDLISCSRFGNNLSVFDDRFDDRFGFQCIVSDKNCFAYFRAEFLINSCYGFFFSDP